MYEVYQEAVNLNQVSPAEQLVACRMRPCRKQEKRGRCATFKQLNLLSISSYWWDVFPHAGCHQHPNSTFPKAHLPGGFRPPHRADCSPWGSWSRFTVGLKLVTAPRGQWWLIFGNSEKSRKHYLFLLPRQANWGMEWGGLWSKVTQTVGAV